MIRAAIVTVLPDKWLHGAHGQCHAPLYSVRFNHCRSFVFHVYHYGDVSMYTFLHNLVLQHQNKVAIKISPIQTRCNKTFAVDHAYIGQVTNILDDVGRCHSSQQRVLWLAYMRVTFYKILAAKCTIYITRIKLICRQRPTQRQPTYMLHQQYQVRH